MDRTRLEKLLTELRAELGDAGGVDSATRESLRRLADDLDRLTGEGEEDRGPHTHENLRQLAVRFETEHPRLAAILSQVVDTLGKMGI